MNELNMFGCALKVQPRKNVFIEPELAAKLVFSQLLGGTSVCRAGGVACRKSLKKPVDLQMLDGAIGFLRKCNIRPFEGGYLGLCTEPFAEQLTDLFPDVVSQGGVFRYKELLIQPVDCYVCGQAIEVAFEYTVGVVFGQGAFAIGDAQFYRFKTYPAQTILLSQIPSSQERNPDLSITKGIEHSFWSVPAHIINDNALVRLEAALPE